MRLVLFILAVISYAGYAQDWKWANYVEGGGNHYCWDVEPSNDSNHVYAVGRYRATATFYGQDSDVVNPLHAGSRDVFVAKIDSSGNYAWVVTEGGTGTDFAKNVTVDENDNVIVGGVTSDVAYYESVELTADSGTDALLLKYDSDGNLIWAKHWSGDGNDEVEEVVSDKNGFIYMAGKQSGNFDYGSGVLVDDGYFIMKLDEDGNVIWCVGGTDISGSSATTISAITLVDSTIYFCGGFTSTAGFGSVSLTSTSAWNDAYFAKMDTSGVVEWAQKAGGPQFDFAFDIEIIDTSIYVAGTYSGTANFDTISMTSLPATYGSPGSVQTNNGRDAFLAKYTEDGSACYWVRDFKSTDVDENRAIHASKEGEILVVGTYDSYNIYSSSASEGDFAINSYDADGNISWSVNPVGVYAAESFAINQDIQGNIYFGGALKGDYTLSPEVDLSLSVVQFNGTFARMYPPMNFADQTIDVCDEELLEFTIPDCYGTPLIYEWSVDGVVQAGETSNSFGTMFTDFDSVMCVVNNGISSDSMIYYINSVDLFTLDLGPDTISCEDSVLLNAGGGATFYDWGSGPVMYDSTIYATSSGEYIVVADKGVCTATDTINVNLVDCTTIEEIVEFYPIVQQNKWLKIVTSESDYSIRIYNMQGAVVGSYMSTKFVNLNHLNQGVYIVHLQTSTGAFGVRKIFLH
ncbi:MAG: T9SS type A sorting domain-containing protein [Crocinitomicaceae bacterium]|nr:T9SS type A sorting domain-containing protein [Crocinitomicaceae bacterium]